MRRMYVGAATGVGGCIAGLWAWYVYATSPNRPLSGTSTGRHAVDATGAGAAARSGLRHVAAEGKAVAVEHRQTPTIHELVVEAISRAEGLIEESQSLCAEAAVLASKSARHGTDEQCRPVSRRRLAG
jgi:type IV secretory pathway TrbL component